MSLLQSAYQADFYPRPPRGGRRLSDRTKPTKKEFLSTPSARRATPTPSTRCWAICRFLSTPSARRATPFFGLLLCEVWISIHALREEGDWPKGLVLILRLYFYPRPPRGGRLRKPLSWCAIWRFLSTPSARRATSRQLWMALPSMISIHALREEGDFGPFSGKMFSLISIHALREEGDMMFALWMPMSCYFYPRPPRGGRLDPHRFTAVSLDISIHALREEGDLLAEIVKPVELISIHALREEGDFFSAVLHPAQSDFYPRPPRGGRPEDAQGTSPLKYFYPRPPRGGRPDDDDIPF